MLTSPRQNGFVSNSGEPQSQWLPFDSPVLPPKGEKKNTTNNSKNQPPPFLAPFNFPGPKRSARRRTAAGGPARPPATARAGSSRGLARVLGLAPARGFLAGADGAVPRHRRQLQLLGRQLREEAQRQLPPAGWERQRLDGMGRFWRECWEPISETLFHGGVCPLGGNSDHF